ncbi:MAG: hypothetical protein DMF72_02990 [Acidobacteria bacterium]|nr:MAG: hypothetical protein DMF72_02990 [Acidobacteriota bacterium]
MEPLKPEIKENLLAIRPEADPADLEEYERLLAERFATDPDRAAAPESKELRDSQSSEERLAELFHRLFVPQPISKS